MRVGHRRYNAGRVLLLAVITLVLQPGCRHTPSYDDIKVDKSGSLANANATYPQLKPSIDQEKPTLPTPDSSPAAAPDSAPTAVPEYTPSPDTSSGASSALPSYVDQKTGQIKNLPLYPHAKLRG